MFTNIVGSLVKNRLMYSKVICENVKTDPLMIFVKFVERNIIVLKMLRVIEIKKKSHKRTIL